MPCRHALLGHAARSAVSQYQPCRVMQNPVLLSRGPTAAAKPQRIAGTPADHLRSLCVERQEGSSAESCARRASRRDKGTASSALACAGPLRGQHDALLSITCKTPDCNLSWACRMT